MSGEERDQERAKQSREEVEEMLNRQLEEKERIISRQNKLLHREIIDEVDDTFTGRAWRYWFRDEDSFVESWDLRLARASLLRGFVNDTDSVECVLVNAVFMVLLFTPQFFSTYQMKLYTSYPPIGQFDKTEFMGYELNKFVDEYLDPGLWLVPDPLGFFKKNLTCQPVVDYIKDSADEAAEVVESPEYVFSTILNAFAPGPKNGFGFVEDVTYGCRCDANGTFDVVDGSVSKRVTMENNSTRNQYMQAVLNTGFYDDDLKEYRAAQAAVPQCDRVRRGCPDKDFASMKFVEYGSFGNYLAVVYERTVEELMYTASVPMVYTIGSDIFKCYAVIVLNPNSWWFQRLFRTGLYYAESDFEKFGLFVRHKNTWFEVGEQALMEVENFEKELKSDSMRKFTSMAFYTRVRSHRTLK